MMGAITLQAVEKWFGELQVIKGLDLEISDGEFVVFVGPSGCGKSTLLRMIGGLEEISRGKLLIDGDDKTADSTVETRPYDGLSVLRAVSPYERARKHGFLSEDRWRAADGD